MSKLLILVLIGLVLLNVFASIRVFTNSTMSTSQRVAQFTLVWILPFFGAIGCISFLSSEAAYNQSAIDRDEFIENGGAEFVMNGNHADSGGCSGDGGGGDGD